MLSKVILDPTDVLQGPYGVDLVGPYGVDLVGPYGVDLVGPYGVGPGQSSAWPAIMDDGSGPALAGLRDVKITHWLIGGLVPAATGAATAGYATRSGGGAILGGLGGLVGGLVATALLAM